MAKSPFERVFSKIDRKRILQKVIREKTKVFLKNSKNQLYTFEAMTLDASLNVKGFIVEGKPREYEKVTALFYIDKERYFINCRMRQEGPYWTLSSDQQFYRLNRRMAYRIQIPPGYDLTYYISTVRNIEINRKAQISEISSGGARIHWPNGRKLSTGSLLKGSLQWGKGNVLPIDASVVHVLETGKFGIKFVHMSPVTANRLKILCLETQFELNGSGQRQP
jgi:hypothetical protein